MQSLIKYGIRLEECRFGERTKLHIEAPISIHRSQFGGRMIKIGAYTYARNASISLGTIGRFCSIATGLVMGGSQHPTQYLSTHPFQYKGKGFLFFKEYKEFQTEITSTPPQSIPKIGNDVWIGTNVVIFRGVTIGNGAIIAAGAVVRSDVEPYSIVGGLPAKHLKYRFDSAEIRQRLLESEWWNYSLSSLQGIPFDNIEQALSELEKRRERGELKVMAPPMYSIEGGDITPLNRQAKKAISVQRPAVSSPLDHAPLSPPSDTADI